VLEAILLDISVRVQCFDWMNALLWPTDPVKKLAAIQNDDKNSFIIADSSSITLNSYVNSSTGQRYQRILMNRKVVNGKEMDDE
jgi:hypothetical protein